MNIVSYGNVTRMDLYEDSNLNDARIKYDEKDYALRIDGEINHLNFLNDFLKYFKDVKQLSVSAYGNGVSYNFLYQMQNLQDIRLSVIYDLDIGKLPLSLKKLDFIWDFNKISFSKNNNSIEKLSITNFNDLDCCRLSNFTSLKDLYIEIEKKGKTLNGIEKLQELESLFAKCKHNSIQGIKDLKNLSYLGITDFKILNLQELKKLKKLKTLYISIKTLEDISAITELQNLEGLTFEGCWNMENFAAIGELKNLKFLEIIDSKKMKSIDFVRKLSNLEQLTLYGTTIVNDYNLEPAMNAKRIYIQNNLKKYNINLEHKSIKGEKKNLHHFH